MAREALTGIRLSSLCLWATIRALNSYCHLMDQCCLETMWSTSGFWFPADKHLQHKASSKASWGWQFVFLAPNSGMQRHECSPPCELATQNQHSNKGKHSLPFSVLSTWLISAFRTDNSVPFIMLIADTYICSVGQTIGVRAQSRVFGTEDLMPTSYQECLREFYPVDWTALSSSREVLEHFFALAPCIRKPPHDLWGCSAKATKLKQVGIAKLKVCFRP